VRGRRPPRRAGGDDFAIFRLTPAGALDSTFGSGGIVSANFGALDVSMRNGLYLQPDGKYLAAGVSISSGPPPPQDSLARFLLDGTPDPGFGTGGKVIVPNPPDFYVRSIAGAFRSDRATLAGSWTPLPLGLGGSTIGASRYCL
jgi:uncharacterized delta-60 repeat protein